MKAYLFNAENGLFEGESFEDPDMLQYEDGITPVTHAGKVLTHTQILKQIWGIGYLEQPHVLRVNISNLRRKIETDPSRPRHTITEPGVGYRLKQAT